MAMSLESPMWNSVTHPPSLFTDLYELAMMQAYYEEGMKQNATFSLYVRHLPPSRNFLLACGLETVLDYVENLCFDDAEIAELAALNRFSRGFLEELHRFQFTGDIRAVPEGTPIFAGEPLLEVTAPIGEAQLLETVILNQIHFQTVAASKAIRVVIVSGERPVADFGARRMHGTDAALKAARAFYIAGLASTSNVLAGRIYGVPVTGTMAHSYIQAHEDEASAFRAFAESFPDATLLIDTYDTLEGARNVIALAGTLGGRFAIRGVRIDSGDLGQLAHRVRRLLDTAGLTKVEIFASGGLDEYEIARLVENGAPIDGFGVGTKMGVSRDAPDLDIAYKLTEYGGKGRMKLSAGKVILPGRKQIFRLATQTEYVRDIVGLEDEQLEGSPLLRPVMRAGKRLPESHIDLDSIRTWARECVSRLPGRLRVLRHADPAYPVEFSHALQQFAAEVRAKIQGGTVLPQQ